MKVGSIRWHLFPRQRLQCRKNANVKSKNKEKLATPLWRVNKVPLPKGWRISGAFIMGQILNLFYALKSCDSLFVLFLIVLSKCEESAETARSSLLALSLTLPLPRSPGDIWCWRRCLYRRGKKCGRFLLLDTKTGGEVNTQSFTRPCAFSLGWKLSGFIVEAKNTYLSIQEEKRNLEHLVWIGASFFFFYSSGVCAHRNN